MIALRLMNTAIRIAIEHDRNGMLSRTFTGGYVPERNLRTNKKNDYLFHLLVPFSTKEHIAPNMSAFKTISFFE